MSKPVFFFFFFFFFFCVCVCVCVMQSSKAPINRSYKKVQVGKDQEKAQSERDSHSKNRGGKKPN